MEGAAKNALFVWCNGGLQYPKELARRLGREDLEIVSPDYITSDRWRGREFSDVVFDHAVSFHPKARYHIQEIRTRIRPVPNGDQPLAEEAGEVTEEAWEDLRRRT
jgi:hypothetical protein